VWCDFTKLVTGPAKTKSIRSWNEGSTQLSPYAGKTQGKRPRINQVIEEVVVIAKEASNGDRGNRDKPTWSSIPEILSLQDGWHVWTSSPSAVKAQAFVPLILWGEKTSSQTRGMAFTIIQTPHCLLLQFSNTIYHINFITISFIYNTIKQPPLTLACQLGCPLIRRTLHSNPLSTFYTAIAIKNCQRNCLMSKFKAAINSAAAPSFALTHSCLFFPENIPFNETLFTNITCEIFWYWLSGHTSKFGRRNLQQDLLQ